jgi:hypothetical protein
MRNGWVGWLGAVLLFAMIGCICYGLYRGFIR